MEEKDMGDIKPEDLTGVEVQFEVELDEEFPGYCSDCSVELEPVTINVRRGRFMILDVTAYKCPVCHKEFVDIDTGSIRANSPHHKHDIKLFIQRSKTIQYGGKKKATLDI